MSGLRRDLCVPDGLAGWSPSDSANRRICFFTRVLENSNSSSSRPGRDSSKLTPRGLFQQAVRTGSTGLQPVPLPVPPPGRNAPSRSTGLQPVCGFLSTLPAHPSSPGRVMGDSAVECRLEILLSAHATLQEQHGG